MDPSLYYRNLKRQLESASHGIFQALVTKQVFRIQLLVSGLALALAFILRFDVTQITIVFALILLWLSFEMMGVALQSLVEVEGDNPQVKASQNYASAASFLISLLAIVVGLYLYLPAIFGLFL